MATSRAIKILVIDDEAHIRLSLKEILVRDGHQVVTVDSGEAALKIISGTPETFDVDAAYRCLSEIRQGGCVSFPVYSRKLHEPIPARGTIDASHNIVVAEGNYLLLNEDPWRRFRQLFDVRVFISADLETLMDGLRERHLRGGKTPAQAERQIRQVDLPNARQVASSVVHAQVLVHKANARRIDRMEQVP